MAAFTFALSKKAEGDALVRRFHYSHRLASRVLLVGTLHEEGGLFGDAGPAVAACFFSVPPVQWSEPVLELSRLVRRPDVEVPLTRLISASCRWVERKHLSDLVVSYADRSHGHHGGIYQAASWKYGGCRAPKKDGVIVSGIFVSDRAASHRWGGNSIGRLASQGIEAVAHVDEGKHLYWRPLNRKGELQAERLGLLALPYPKPDRAAT